MKILRSGLIIFFASLWITACGTVGNDFDLELAKTVKNGKTTKQEVRQLLGKPFKTGIQNGQEVWVYEENKYKALGEDSSKNFIVVFDDQGVVKSSQMMTSEPTP